MRTLDSVDLELVLSETRPLWEEMRNQRIFITGGTGFFGRWLLESFLFANRRLELNAQATVLSRDPDSFSRRAPHLGADPAITLVQGEVRGFVQPTGDFAYVIHAATDVAAITERPTDRFASIVDGTATVLGFAATHNTRKFLLTSSGAVYGKQPSELSHIPETYIGSPDVLHASSVYGEGKRASELMCALHAECSAMEIKIARCFAFAGPCLPLDGTFAIGNFIRDAIEGGPIQIGGDGTSVRSYLYAADLAIWLWTMLFRAPSMQAFHVGSEDAISIGDLAKLVAKTLNPRVEINLAKQPAPGVAGTRYVPSTEGTRAVLQLHQTVGLEEAIRRMAAWYGYGANQGR
ncbi:MAG: NAD(P)-dependent oxidoreductase [Acidobacteriota bacterium]|nr:NAD(P)-dependent oxidoreductase [Acidobacteriota bacterium]